MYYLCAEAEIVLSFGDKAISNLGAHTGNSTSLLKPAGEGETVSASTLTDLLQLEDACRTTET